ncbi:SOS response-associated peptidase family protein [Deinococcus humi]
MDGGPGACAYVAGRGQALCDVQRPRGEFGGQLRFREAFQNQRCVIPLAGSWEWSVREGVKIQVRIARRHFELLPVAGLWNCVQTLDRPLKSCMI